METLINAGAQLDARDFDGCAAIHHAAAVGHSSTLHELVVAGSSHAWRSNNFQTPLAVACFSGKWKNVKYLLDNCGADPGVIDGLRHTPLQTASHHGHLAVVKLLLGCDVHQLGPNAYPGALCAAAMAGNVSVLRALLVAEGRAHVNGTEIGTKMTPLLYSAGNCHPIPTAMLLEAGGDEAVVNLDLVDSYVSQGLAQRRVRRMLEQAPAYRARSWRWPGASTALARSSITASAAKPAEPTSWELDGVPMKRVTESVGVSAENLGSADDIAIATATAIAGMQMVGVRVFRRPHISSSGSVMDRHPVAVLGLIRYIIQAVSI